MRQILLIAYYYAPQANPGTRRVGAFVRYLPEFGYRAAVLTTDRRGSLPDDPAQLIFRAPDLMAIPAEAIRRLRQTAQRAPAAAISQPVIAVDSRVSQLLSRVLVPDLHATWLPAAISRGTQLLRAGTFSAIVSSSPPETNHLVALQLKRASGLPWIADLRDGWMFEPLNAARLNSRWRAPIERRLERAVITSADACVTVNAVIAADLRRRYPDRAERIHVIPNGFEPAQFAELVRQPPARFRIVYTGALSWSRAGTSLDGFLAALDRLRPTLAQPDTIEMVIAGPLAVHERTLLARSSWRDALTLTGPIPHRDALQHQLDASVLLLVTEAHNQGVTTSKIFEYLASGRPILALTGGSAAAALVREFDAGLVVPPDDPAAIAEALGQLYARWQHGDLPTRQDPRVRRYERRNLTGTLAGLLDALMGVGPAELTGTDTTRSRA